MRGAEFNDFFAAQPIKPRAEVYDWQGVDDVGQKICLKYHFSKHCC